MRSRIRLPGKWWFMPPKRFVFRDPKITVTAGEENGRPVLKLHAEAFARRICLDFGEADVILEDNFFDLQPGQHKTIGIEEIRSPQGASVKELMEELKGYSNFDLAR